MKTTIFTLALLQSLVAQAGPSFKCSVSEFVPGKTNLRYEIVGTPYGSTMMSIPVTPTKTFPGRSYEAVLNYDGALLEILPVIHDQGLKVRVSGYGQEIAMVSLKDSDGSSVSLDCRASR